MKRAEEYIVKGLSSPVGEEERKAAVISAIAVGAPVLLEGPPSVGKSYLAEIVARRWGLPFITAVVGNTTTADWEPVPTLEGGYRFPAFLSPLQRGGILLLDEVGAGDFPPPLATILARPGFWYPDGFEFYGLKFEGPLRVIGTMNPEGEGFTDRDLSDAERSRWIKIVLQPSYQGWRQALSSRFGERDEENIVPPLPEWEEVRERFKEALFRVFIPALEGESIPLRGGLTRKVEAVSAVIAAASIMYPDHPGIVRVLLSDLPPEVGEALSSYLSSRAGLVREVLKDASRVKDIPNHDLPGLFERLREAFKEGEVPPSKWWEDILSHLRERGDDVVTSFFHTLGEYIPQGVQAKFIDSSHLWDILED